MNELLICGSNHNEEFILNLILKNLDQSNHKAVRAAAARCLASLRLKLLLVAHENEESEARHVEEMFRELSSIYNRATTKRTRSVVAGAYAEILNRMGSSWITQFHPQILSSVLNDLQLAVPMNERHQALMTRRHVQILLRKIGAALDQENQLLAVGRILAHIRTAPSRHILVTCLGEISALVTSLQSATPADLEFEPIYFLMSHPIHSVQIAAASTLKTIALNLPSLLANLVSNVFTRLKDELAGFADAEQTAKNLDCIGYAFSLAALTTAGVSRPLYISLDKTANQILNLANDTLKASAKSTINTSGIQVQVAWTLIGSLQSLGPTFVRSHLSQLLLLWKNALPKPLTKDVKTGLPLLFLLHVRDTALSSVYAFLKNCRQLCTADVVKRVSTMISNSLAFLTATPIPALVDEKLFNLSAVELESRVRRRILACLLELEQIDGGEMEESGVTALAGFADPRTNMTVSLGYVNIWEMSNNFAFGLAPHCKPAHEIDDLLEVPIFDAVEHDYIHLFIDNEPEESPPADNRVVELGIQLFANLFHKQGPQVQESLVAQMASLCATTQNQRNSGRKTAVQINCVLAIRNALSKEDIAAVPQKVMTALNELLQEGLADNDMFLRDISAEALGLLSTMGGSAMTSTQVNELVDKIVKDRDPYVRGGCTTALGYIHKSLGGIAAVYHLKSILNVLVSLASDPHPVVHYHAIEALRMTIESSGLSFIAHTNSTLGLILKLYVSDVLDPETGNSASSNLAIDLPNYHALAQCADGLVNIIGPDLEDNTHARELLIKLVGELLLEKDQQLVADGLICTQHLALFAPKKLDLTSYIISLHYHLRLSHELTQQATVDGLYQLMRVDANEVIRQSSITSRYDTALWLLLNSRPDWQTVKDIIHAWLSQTKHEFVYWIELFQQIMIRQRLSESDKDSAPRPKLVEQSIEDEGSSLGNATTNEPKDEMLRWQTRLFALQCLHELILSLPAEALTGRVGDLVRMAFSASTSKVTVLQVEGLRFLRSIISHFKDARDPDFPEAALLEQHQAQLGSALTPAFSVDSSPDVAALAVHVCAEFIASGIIEDVDRMGRILRLLNTALDSCRDSEAESSFEAFKSYADNAKSMIKIAILSAWAELQVSSVHQEYLIEVVAPYVKDLTPMWLDSLKDYAQIKFEPVTSGNSMEVQYSTLSRETIVNFYSRAWLNFVHAIATLIDQDKDFVFNALDNRPASNGGGDIDYRGEPAAFFMVLFGICFEALAHASMESPGDRNYNIEVLTALQSILKPAVCGKIVYTEPIFTEIVDLFGRLLLTEGIATQIVIVDIAASLALSHPNGPAALESGDSPESERLQEYVDQLFDLARLTILPLTIVFSWDRTENGKEVSRVDVSLPKLARSCLTHFVTLSERFPPVIKLDFYNSLFHVFGNVFCSANTQETVVPAVLPPFKDFIQNVANSLQNNLLDDVGMIFGPARHVLRKLITIETTSSLHLNNNILASTILVQNLGYLLSPKDKLVPLFSAFILSHLSNQDVQKSATWSLKTLLATKQIQLSTTRRQLTMALADAVLNKSQGTSGSSLSLLFDFCQNQSDTLSSLSFLVPLLLHYDNTTQDPITTRRFVSSKLLHFIQLDAAGFKKFVDGMSQSETGVDKKTALESIVRQGMETGKKEQSGSEVPAISLRMAFGEEF